MNRGKPATYLVVSAKLHYPREVRKQIMDPVPGASSGLDDKIKAGTLAADATEPVRLGI